MYKVYGHIIEGGQLKLKQYQETDKRAMAFELAEQFRSWGLLPAIIEWRKNWQQGRDWNIPRKEG